MEYEAEDPQNDILYFPWKHLPQSIIDKVGYERIQQVGGLQLYSPKLDTSNLKPGEKTKSGYMAGTYRLVAASHIALQRPCRN
jgi:hypothetical protein